MLHAWWFKIAAKLVLARIPLPYQMVKNLIFRNGGMDSPDYALNTFNKHAALAAKHGCHQGTLMEIGPGDSLLTAVYARKNGFSQVILVDHGEYAMKQLGTYAQAWEKVPWGAAVNPFSVNFASFAEMLQDLNARYLTQGVSALSGIPDNSVDFCFSQAVLEHVRFGEFDQFAQELFRVMKPGAVSSHVVDYKDHLQAGLNNLRFSEKCWEADWFAAGSRFYTNRLGYNRMSDMFRRAGFQVDTLSTVKFTTLNPPKAKMATPFNQWPDDALLISGAHLLLTKPR